MDEIFETERNRFCYPIEPEAVYIRGDFDVTARGKAGRAIRYISVEADGFRIGRPTPKAYGELTAQNLWFYRGNARYDFSVRKREGERIALRIPAYHGALVVWQTNGAEGCLFEGAMEAELTDFLREGDNPVTLILYGTNRNLLGPHHHVTGESDFGRARHVPGTKGV